MFGKIVSIFFILLFNISVLAQVNSDSTSQDVKKDTISQTVKRDFRIEFGLRDEITNMFSDQSMFGSNLFNLHVVFGLRIFQNFKVSYKIGVLELLDDYGGMDHGLILEGRLSRFMASVGIIFLKMHQESHGAVSSSGNGNQRGILMSAGYYFSDHFLFDVHFYSPVGNSIYAKRLGKEYVNHGFWGLAFQANVF